MPLGRKVPDDGLGALLRQCAVLVGDAGSVRVALNFDETDLLVSDEHASHGIEDLEALLPFDLVLADGELDPVMDGDPGIGHLDQRGPSIGTPVCVLISIVGLWLGRALIDVVGDAVPVGIAHVGAPGAIPEIVRRLGDVRALVEIIRHAIVIAIGAAVVGVLRVADHVGPAGVGALVDVVGDAVVIAVRNLVGAAVAGLIAVRHFGVIGALVEAVLDAVSVAVAVRTAVVAVLRVANHVGPALVGAPVDLVRDAVVILCRACRRCTRHRGRHARPARRRRATRRDRPRP